MDHPVGGKLDRRAFVGTSLGIAGGLSIGGRLWAQQPAAAPTYSRDRQIAVAVNQRGYLPRAAKACVVKGDQPTKFQVIRLTDQKVAFEGRTELAGDDFGLCSVGRFDQLAEPGSYYIELAGGRSCPFHISRSVYDAPLQSMVAYFAKQRCGASESGYLSPCHVDDGVRRDNGQHQDVSGGWHDASDLRKWVGATIFGIIGLSRLKQVLDPAWGDGRILEELRWGNRYFLAMQEPDGYVMSHIGGDVLEHSDSNRWTDNRIGPEGGQLRTVKPPPESSSAPVTVMGNKDDRVIETEPLTLVGQFNFARAEAAMARLTRESDPDYSRRCRNAARRCFDWFERRGGGEWVAALGAAIEAAVEMAQASGEDRYRELAVERAERLMEKPVAQWLEEPATRVSRGCQPLLGMVALLENFPEHPRADAWKQTVATYCQNYLLPLAKRNGYGIVPLGLYQDEDPGGDRRFGDFWYRYFMSPENDWWVGINANLASTGVALCRAGRILRDPDLAALAQRQLDWILGANPLNASTVEGTGYHHPERFVNGNEFRPPTPRIRGGVMNGLGGTTDDQPAKHDGSYNTAEYWTPMVGYTMWLMAELQASGTSSARKADR